MAAASHTIRRHYGTIHRRHWISPSWVPTISWWLPSRSQPTDSAVTADEQKYIPTYKI